MTRSGTPERALELADEAWGRFDVDAVAAHLAAAIRGFTDGGDPCGAALACARLGDLYANAFGNLTAAQAWFSRARRLVADEPPCLAQGWVAVAAMGCDVDDPDVLLERAELALDRARRFGDVNLETKALADAGLAHVQLGRIAHGMALLDEAMALVCGQADDVDAASKSVCSFFTACYFTADAGRVGSWSDPLRRHGLLGDGPGGQAFLSSHCDSVRATMLVELGRWGEADAVLTRAIAHFEQAIGMPSWHPAIALADLRTRQGRLADAEALLLGKEQSVQALLPAARLHLARGDLVLARMAATRGLRGMGDDRLRAAELLAVLVEVELAAGAVERAAIACADLTRRLGDVEVPALLARSAAARAGVGAATGDVAGAIATLEAVVDRLDGSGATWPRADLLLRLARLREGAGDVVGARVEAATAAAVLATLDVVVGPTDRALLERLAGARPTTGAPAATLGHDDRGWCAAHGGTTVRLRETKGLRHLAELLARPGEERHALDLVDRDEGVDPDGRVDRRHLGGGVELLDGAARTAYRRRIEALRGEIDEALDGDRLETAERLQGELDALVAELSRAFGLGGRGRPSGSAAERARLNVTRAIRAATATLADALPEAGAALDRCLRTGTYCAYEPAEHEIPWVVRSEVNGEGAD